MTTMSQSGIALLLRKEFSRRKEKNERYSLRAFSNFLGVSHSFLSRVLNEKETVSVQTWEKIAKRLSLDPKLTVRHKQALLERKKSKTL